MSFEAEGGMTTNGLLTGKPLSLVALNKFVFCVIGDNGIIIVLDLNFLAIPYYNLV